VIVNVSSTSTIQLSEREDPLSILYSATAPQGAIISSFYEPAGGGTRTVISTLLPAGDGQFRFDPADAGVGTYRVGLIIRVGDEDETILSAGVIQVQGPPNPVFVVPHDATDWLLGQDMVLRFDAQDPEDTNVNWRVFYLGERDSRDVPADELGTQLGAPGTGNVGQRVFATANLTPGAYVMGISAADTGDTISAAVAKGEEARIVTVFGPTVTLYEELEPRAPKIEVIAPGSSAEQLFGNQSFSIAVEASVFEPGATGLVEVFYDLDNDFNLGFAGVIGTASISSSSSGAGPTPLTFPLPTDDATTAADEGLPEGTYYIGATISDGINPMSVDYASGTITIVRTPFLSVTAPDLSLPIPPADPTDPSSGVRVEWSTNVPVSGGTVYVFARALDKDGVLIGSEQPIVSYPDTSITTAVFLPEKSGVFEIFVKISLTDPSIAEDACPKGTCAGTAPKPVRVSTLPPVLWLGSLAEADRAFEGAVFLGISAEDNTGSSMSPAGDLDGDGMGEFVIGARYGKSFLTTPPLEIGPGQAFVIYGASGDSRLLGVYDLRLLGSTRFRGVSLTGVRTVGDSPNTDGLSTIALMPDADGDSTPEILLGFPWADSACVGNGRLCTPGHFLNGGVVILSSDNDILRNPVSVSGTQEIDCGAVGQLFTDMSRTDRSGMLQDLLEFPEDDPGAEVCQPGSDGVPDTILGPAEGFIEMLAWDIMGFTPIPPGTSIGIDVCVTEYDVPTCTDASGEVVLGGEIVGSGFYPADTVGREPKGARIIGPEDGAGFGTSVTIADVSSTITAGELIISAPNRDGLVGVVDGLSVDIAGAGVAYAASNRNLWGEVCYSGTPPTQTDCVQQTAEEDPTFFSLTPPTPHQYVMGVNSHCGVDRALPLDPLRVVGQSGESIQNVVAIKDLNGDGRDDLAVGVPSSNGGEGRVYVLFRRESTVDYLLDNLELDEAHPDRFDGLLITSSSPARLGASFATDVDFNGDGEPDLVIGSPDADNQKGAVIIVFSDPDLATPAEGIAVTTLLEIRSADGSPRAARITADTSTSERARFGYNVANAGDVNGDGFNDLLIAAPNATPRYDSDPTNDEDVFDEVGVDTNFDGEQDDVGGAVGLDDQDDLINAGLVYLVYGGARLDRISSFDRTIGIDELGSGLLSGLVIAGRATGDRLGGGDAGDVAQGGHGSKSGRGRSRGLATAGDVDGDGRADILLGSVLADGVSETGEELKSAGESYLIYGTALGTGFGQ
jgi:hypothetical protein